MGFLSEWGAQFPTVGSTAMDAPPGYMTLYAAFSGMATSGCRLLGLLLVC
ncbi:hypothetical protein Hanom_Chr06g00530081 [Helianthus anomalus]